MMTKFKIHPFYYVVAIISIMNGFFKYFIYISLIIFVHEIGHIVGAKICNWNIDKIIILPFGGIIIFDELLNRRIIEEFIIVMLGPSFQIFWISIINLILKSDILFYYSTVILILNLIPIIPLDGSKLLNLITDYIFPYQKSYEITIYISFLLLFFSIIYIVFNFNLILLLMIFFLIIKNINEYQNKKYRFNKFVLERRNHLFLFKKVAVIDNISKMKRDYKHIFVIQHKQYTENTILFDKQRKTW